MAQGHRGARPHVPGKQAAKVVKGFEEKVGHGLRGRSPFVRPLSALKRVRESAAPTKRLGGAICCWLIMTAS